MVTSTVVLHTPDCFQYIRSLVVYPGYIDPVRLMHLAIESAMLDRLPEEGAVSGVCYAIDAFDKAMTIDVASDAIAALAERMRQKLIQYEIELSNTTAVEDVILLFKTQSVAIRYISHGHDLYIKPTSTSPSQRLGRPRSR